MKSSRLHQSDNNCLAKQTSPRSIQRSTSFPIGSQRFMDKLEMDILLGTSQLQLLQTKLQKIGQHMIKVEDFINQMAI
eukprot:EST44150.1 Hypothetical protein SS50377_16052 [Spironucleus salmonicida]